MQWLADEELFQAFFRNYECIVDSTGVNAIQVELLS